MNIISYNVRGLGGGVKWPAIRRLVNNHHIDLLCIQETKRRQSIKACVNHCGGTRRSARRHYLQLTRRAEFCVYGVKKHSD